MNILRHKRWHVRTKENIARVRKDQAEAAEKEKQITDRAKLAEREHRTQLMRERAAANREASGLTIEPQVEPVKIDADDPSSSVISEQPFDFHTFNKSSSTSTAEAAQKRNEVNITGEDGHINFFVELERQERTTGGNKEHEEEKRLEREAEEKKIGLLKYLGEGSQEYEKDKPWWQRLPKREKDIPKVVGGLRVKGDYDVPHFVKESQQTRSTNLVATATGVALAARTVPRNNDEPVFVSELIRKETSSIKAEPKLEPKVKKSKKDKKKHKKKKHRRRSSSESSIEEAPRISMSALEQLRHERIMREAGEKLRTEQAIRRAKGIRTPTPPPAKKQKYNSQFNPDAARQNRKSKTPERPTDRRLSRSPSRQDRHRHRRRRTPSPQERQYAKGYQGNDVSGWG